MYKRNLLKPGDYVLAVPVGLHLTLEYNTSGNLARVYKGFNLDKQDVTSKLMMPLLASNTVPGKIHITSGKTWVTGVLYTGTQFSASGDLPQAVYDSLVDSYLKYPDKFNFFAATAESTIVPLKGANQMRSTLMIDNFHLLPAWVAPANVSDDAFTKWINSDRFPFNDPIISDCIIFRGSDILYESLQLKQFTVDHIEKYVDDNGYIKARVYNTDNNVPIAYDYSDIVRWSIGTNSLLVLDSDNQPVHSKYIGRWKAEKRSNTLTCSFCGKAFSVPSSGYVQCSDPHCTSKLLSKVTHFLSVLRMDVPKSTTILALIKSHTLTCIPDLFLLDTYANKRVETTLACILRAFIPVKLITNNDVFTLFANACNNNIKTFLYYAQNTDCIASDLGIKHPDLNKLIMWFHDPCNLSDLTTVVTSVQIIFHNQDKRFNGAPIFRGKTICLTGDFVHGSITDVSAILSSYAAHVTTHFTSDVDCVITGSVRENIDSKVVSSARSYNIPIFDETSFFAEYEIDTDLQSVMS